MLYKEQNKEFKLHRTQDTQKTTIGALWMWQYSSICKKKKNNNYIYILQKKN